MQAERRDSDYGGPVAIVGGRIAASGSCLFGKEGRHQGGPRGAGRIRERPTWRAASQCGRIADGSERGIIAEAP